MNDAQIETLQKQEQHQTPGHTEQQPKEVSRAARQNEDRTGCAKPTDGWRACSKPREPKSATAAKNKTDVSGSTETGRTRNPSWHAD
jgi:hypothetical protein